jgi:hypothetical protein
MADSKSQRSSPILVVLCALGLVAFLILVIYPNDRTLSKYDRQISDLKREIALRQALAPLYKRLVEKLQIVPPNQLVTQEKTTLDIENTGRLTQIFQEIATETNLSLESVIPDAQAFNQITGQLLVEVVFRGDFLNVQPLINTIGKRSYVDHIRRLQVRATGENKRIGLTISLFHQ